MEKKDVIEFFDRCAPSWDAEMIKSDAKIGKILDNAEVGEGMEILDVACGTGVMFDYYLQRGVASVTGIDISPEMAKIAAAKFEAEPKVQVICGDVEEYKFDRKFDRIVVYNAFPHFPYPKRLIKILAGLLKEDGRLTVAHGQSREAIDGHHKGSASKVSNGLMSAESLKKLFDPHFEVEIMISNSRMYQVSGVKRDPILMDGINLELSLDENRKSVEIKATVSCDGRTGVEMEALTAVSTAALTVYDMCKAVQKNMVITDIRLLSKTGGVHGDYFREE